MSRSRDHDEEYSDKLIDSRNEDIRIEQIRKDPSSIPGMTQEELNSVINTGKIPPSLARKITKY